MTVKYQSTNTLSCKDNNNSSDVISPNYVYGCAGGCMKSYCVEEGTLINTLNGLVPVEKIQHGDSVFSYNTLLEQVELSLVNQTSSRESETYFEIQVGHRKIVVTPEHPFYIVGKGWVEAQYLTEDDVTLCGDFHTKGLTNKG